MNLFKPVNSDKIGTLLVQIMVGLAVTLIIASFIKPVPGHEPMVDPFGVFAFVEQVYDWLILCAVYAAEQIPIVAILGAMVIIGDAFMVVAGKIVPYVVALIKIIIERKKQDE